MSKEQSWEAKFGKAKEESRQKPTAEVKYTDLYSEAMNRETPGAVTGYGTVANYQAQLKAEQDAKLAKGMYPF